MLEQAARCQALGLVVGGLAEHLRARVEAMGLIVVVTDGLGAVPMAAPIFQRLVQSNGREGLMTGGRGGLIPEPPALSVPLAGAQGPVAVSRERPLTIGDRVRVTRAPYLGATGWVQAIQTEDGETWVRVSLDGRSVVQVLYRNLERLE